jgi:hypothetical protein
MSPRLLALDEIGYETVIAAFPKISIIPSPTSDSLVDQL